MKNSYSVNKDNALIIETPKSNQPLVSKGRFKVNKKNELEYKFNETNNWRAVYNFPERLTFKGRWRLDKNHDLVFNVREKKTKTYSLLLRGLITDVGKNRLTFQIKSRTKGRDEIWYSLKLKGNWKADKHNRIVFDLGKDQFQDRLVFRGSWDLNKEQKIEYTYSKTKLKTKTKIERKLIFNGFWQLDERNSIKFIISKDESSYFNFKVFAGSKNIYPKKGELKFRIGVGTGKSRRNKIITFFGTWKFHRKAGLSYELDYGEKRIKAIRFNFETKFQTKDTLVLNLKNLDNKPIGLVVTFKRKLLKDIDLEYFLRMGKKGNDRRYDLGATLRF